MDGSPKTWTSADGIMIARAAIAEAVAPVEKRPLYRSLPSPPEFPVSALGPLEDAARAIQDMTQAPMAICAQSVLAAATLAVQAQRDVSLPAGGQKPLTGLFVSVAESGERKSSVDRIALAAVYDVEREWLQTSDAGNLAYQNDKAAWELTRDGAKKQNKADKASLLEALNVIGPEPKPPPHPMLLISDPTPEALVMHLSNGRPFAGVFTAEGGLLIGGAAFNDEAKTRMAALLNTLWDGDAIRRKRVGTGATYLPGRRCTLHVMLQPVIADGLFGQALFDGIGLTARMLLVAPDSTAGTRLYRSPSQLSTAVLEIYNQRIRSLLLRPLVFCSDSSGALDPPKLTLSPAAEVIWIGFHDDCERALVPGGSLHRIRAFGGKLAEHAGRLAAILTVYDNPEAEEVSAAAMHCGVALATHYANEMLRLADGASIPRDLKLAQRLADWWQRLPEPILHLAKIYQTGPTDLRFSKAARAATEILEEHGWIARLAPGTVVDGAPRKEVWRLL